MKRRWIAALALASAASVQAQVAQYLPPDESMRAIWRENKVARVVTSQDVHGRVVSFALPRPFLPAFRSLNGGAFTMEYVPDGETPFTWTRMVTVTGTTGVGAADVTHEAIVGLLNPRSCGAGAVFADLGEAPAAPGLSRRDVLIGCDYPDGTQERAAIAHFRDRNHVWTVQYAERTRAAGVAPPTLTATNAREALSRLGEIKLCGSAEEPGCKDVVLIEKIRAGASRP